MLYHEQVFGNVFDRRESKCCGVLMKHHRKVKGEQLVTLQMAQQLETKNINVVPGQLFCRNCKAKFLLATDSLYWWSKLSSICYRYWQWIHWMSPRKMLLSIDILFVILHGFMKTLKSNISKVYKVQVGCLKIQSPILMKKMIWNRKWMTWLGCTRQCKKN